MKHLNIAFIIIVLSTVLTNTIASAQTYENKYIGKKLTDTPFGKYVTEPLRGTTFLMFISYGCEHCEMATRDVMKFSDQTDQIILLGFGTEEEKTSFDQNTHSNFKKFDYDFEEIQVALLGEDKNFPPPPLAIWLEGEIIQKIFVKIPSPAKFKKMKQKLEK